MLSFTMIYLKNVDQILAFQEYPLPSGSVFKSMFYILLQIYYIRTIAGRKRTIEFKVDE
jgi:hypothetical protein